jgi:formylglycine-generating enzyme required for sulfatase activity
MKRKVIRGGSWKDVGYYLQTGTSTYEYQDSTKSYIGFRTVIDLPAQTSRRR